MKRPAIETWKSEAKAHNGNITPKMVRKLFKYVEFLEGLSPPDMPDKIEKEMFEYSKRLPHGHPTETPISHTSENYVEFFYSSPNDADILLRWKSWFFGYIDFVESLFYEGEDLGAKVLYWRKRPEVVFRDGVFEAYARLLISKRKP